MALNNTKKGQSLPLNTIVIAILVILVLLIIVVFFTTNVGRTDESINSVSSCDISNPAISGLGYKQVDNNVDKSDTLTNDEQCKSKKGSSWDYIAIAKAPDKKICCGTKS